MSLCGYFYRGKYQNLSLDEMKELCEKLKNDESEAIAYLADSLNYEVPLVLLTRLKDVLMARGEITIELIDKARYKAEEDEDLAADSFIKSSTPWGTLNTDECVRVFRGLIRRPQTEDEPDGLIRNDTEAK